MAVTNASRVESGRLTNLFARMPSSPEGLFLILKMVSFNSFMLVGIK